ncbi:hypothetical protein RRG08_051741 [Elysia crispata]|uniref:Glycosyltransferase family 92 protein n=1 Tax=Elysia crispata TaxID=231223 RepID=A0AAE1BBA5_9GAST|nr:hypothetical protein RRG08_051741 [Elysia crispata]
MGVILRRLFPGTALTGVLVLCYIAISIGWKPKWESHNADDTDVKEEKPSLRVVNPGETIQPHPLQIHISTVVSHADFPALGGFNLFLNGWARYREDVDFKCCLVRAGADGSLLPDVLTQVKAWMYHQFTMWIVDMQATEFSCSISRDQLSALGLDNFTHVALVENTCLEAPREVLPILFPRRVAGSVGVCLKVSYGALEATRVLEWMEYHRMMAVTSVFTYTWDLDPQAQTVFDYYARLGFLTAVPAHPPPSKEGPKRGFRRPRYEQQAWVDEVWAANDCKHRMSGLDYVIVMDIDEYIVPKRGLKTYHDVLEAAHNSNPGAGGFSFDSHVFLLNWGATRESPLHLGNFTLRTKTPNYSGFDQNSRWASMPGRTYFLLNNLVVPRKPFVTAPVPSDLYTLYHYRSCKVNWKGCDTRSRLEDKSMIQHELPLVERILALPNLGQLLYDDSAYVRKMRHWLDKRQKNASGV